MARHTSASFSLLLLLVGCGESASNEAIEDDAEEPDGGYEQPYVLDMQAVVYTASFHEEKRGEVWLRRREEDAPVLLDRKDGAIPTEVCIHPDGSGYALWFDFGSELHAPHVRTFAVDHDGARLDEVALFPDGLHPTGCPVGWGVSGAYVNLTEETAYAAPSGLPHRLAPDGTAEPVDGAQASWERLGRYAAERRPSPDDDWSSEVVVWNLWTPVPTPIVTWTGPSGVDFRWDGPWVVVTRRGAETSIVPVSDPTRALATLTERTDATIVFSPSGEFAILVDPGERDAWIEVLHVVDGEVTERSGGATFAGAGQSSPSVSDAGVAVFSTVDHAALTVSSVDGSVRELDRADPTSDYRFVSGVHLPVADAVLIRRFGGAPESWVLRSLVGEADVTFPVPQGCGLFGPHERWGYIACDEGTLGVVDFTNPKAAPISLEQASLAGARPVGVREQLWNAESWHILDFTRADGYTAKLFEPTTREMISLDRPGANVTLHRLLPIAFD